MPETYATLIHSRLDTLKKMRVRYDRKHSSYSWKANGLALTLGLFGVIAALRDQLAPHMPGGAVLFILLGALTTVGV